MPLIQSSRRAAEDAASPIAEMGADALQADLQSDDAAVRRAAVLRARHCDATVLLAGCLEVESDHGIREMILTNLVRNGGLAAARPLVNLLRSDDADLRNAVLETLQGMSDAITPLIEDLLADPDSDVRIFAVNILQSLKSPTVPDLALRVISTDPHVNVCAAAVDVLAEVGRPEIAGALRDVAARFPDEPFLAFAVRTALKRIG